jgi:hypothetical protein
MKPVHIVLLVLGAALAGALAVKMTQPPVIPAATVAPAVPAIRTAVPTDPKPTPVPDAAPPSQVATPAAAPAAAPAPVYLQPEKPAPVKPAVRKNKPSPLQETRLRIPEVQQPPPYEPPPPGAAVPPDPQLQPVPQAVVPEPPPPAPVSAPEPSPLPPPAPRQVTLRTGTAIPVRIDESLSSDRNVAGDTFNGSLAEPLVVDGLVIAERGAHVTGRILDAQRAGRVSGTAVLGLALTGLHTSDGQRVAISTEPWTKQADNSHVEDAEKIGGGAALGAIIGAIAGGGKGAAIGAGIGGGAGAGTVMATRGKAVNVPTETVVRFRLASRVTITERP